MRKDQKGFSLLPLLIIILLVVVGIGAYVYSSSKEEPSTSNSTNLTQESSSAEEEIVADSPQALRSDGWLEYETEDYTIKFPDGWKLEESKEYKNFSGYDNEGGLEYKPGVPATVLVEELGGDAMSLVFYYNESPDPEFTDVALNDPDSGCDSEDLWEVETLENGNQLTVAKCYGYKLEGMIGGPQAFLLVEHENQAIEVHQTLTDIEESKWDERVELLRDSLRTVEFKN